MKRITCIAILIIGTFLFTTNSYAKEGCSDFFSILITPTVSQHIEKVYGERLSWQLNGPIVISRNSKVPYHFDTEMRIQVLDKEDLKKVKSEDTILIVVNPTILNPYEEEKQKRLNENGDIAFKVIDYIKGSN